MAGIEFDEDQQAGSRVSSQVAKTSSFVRLVRKAGLAKTDQGANYVLIGIAIVVIVIAILIIALTYAPHSLPPAPPAPSGVTPGTTNP